MHLIYAIVSYFVEAEYFPECDWYEVLTCTSPCVNWCSKTQQDLCTSNTVHDEKTLRYDQSGRIKCVERGKVECYCRINETIIILSIIVVIFLLISAVGTHMYVTQL